MRAGIIVACLFASHAHAQSKAPLVLNGTSFLVPKSVNIESCTADRYYDEAKGAYVESGMKVCSYPSLTPCVDKDNDGFMNCGKNETTPLYHPWEVGDDFTIQKASASSVFPNKVMFSNCEPVTPNPQAIVDFASRFTIPVLRCGAGWGNGGGDCDDKVPTIGGDGYPGNTAPIESIVYLNREATTAQSIEKERKVRLTLTSFNPYDRMIIGIRTNPCVTHMQAEVLVNVGVGQPISLGKVWFGKSSFERLQEWGVPYEEDYRRPGVLWAEIPSLYSDLRSTDPREALEALMRKVRISGEQRGVTSGPAPATLLVKTELGTKTIPFSLNPCVPIFGSGPIGVAFSRSDRFSTLSIQNGFRMSDWIERPIKAANAFASEVLETPPLKQNRNLFAVFADLSLISESSERGPELRHVMNRCGEPIQFFESALNKRAYTAASMVIMDPTDPSYKNYTAFSLGGDYLLTMTHELGHALGSLRDEYDHLEWNPGNDPSYKRYFTMNCAKESAVKDAFPAPGNVPDPKRAICGARGSYRSTVGSMMNNHWEVPKFNVVSCAYLMAAMRGGVAKDYFATCEGQEYDAVRE